MNIKLLLLFCLMAATASAQQQPLQYFRPNTKGGLHVFETDKKDTVSFNGLRVRIGGNFSQDFQALSHQNDATALMVDNVNTNQLIGLKNGFDLAMANLNIDAQLADGIRMNLSMYLSSRHHSETWVKGGYIQFDKLTFLKSDFIDNIMKHVTIKVGDYEVDYGDQHYRRTDGGNAIYNPFVENYIMDEFTTEIGGEIYYHHKSGVFAMVGVTNGELNPTVVSPTKIDTVTGELNKYTPAIHGKLGYDKQVNKDLRVRLTASFYVDKSAASNTLFAGDRTGSHYFYVMENTAATSDGNFRSGRYTPQFSQEVAAVMINPFIKYKGLELFGTYEMAKGRLITEPDMRTAQQYAVDLIYRFPEGKENFWIGGRYNAVTATLPKNDNDITISRTVGSAGWFVTRNIMLKGEYVSQVYSHFASSDIRSGGSFKGIMMAAVVGF